jgi:predicted MPP superfamily phosphohydrolase
MPAAGRRRVRPIKLAPVLAFIAVWLGGSCLVIGAVLQRALPGGWLLPVVVVAYCAVAVYQLLRGITGAAYPSARTRLLLFRPFWYLMAFLPLLAAAGVLGATAGLPFGAGAIVGRWSVTALAVFLAVGSLAGYLGSRQLVLRQLEVRLPNLPAALDGLRVVQISDIHVGPHTSRRHLTCIADTARSARPDLVAYTGDQVDDFCRDVEHFVAAFGGLTAAFGVYAVAGNHDVIAGWDCVHKGLSNAGITVLVNESVPIGRDGAQIWIAGTGDPAGEAWHRGGGRHAAPDIERTLRRIPPRALIVVLAHNPVLWPDLARSGVDLTLSGHTHYGQLSDPGLRWSLASPFLELSMGSHRRDDALLYISPGSDYWGIPFRIGTPPEVTVLVLRQGHTGTPPSISAIPGALRRVSTLRRSRRDAQRDPTASP